MSDEQPTSGTTVNPAAKAHASRHGAPVMDVVPPPAPEGAPGAPAEAPVVAAPPQESEGLQISDEIAEQIAADSTTPPSLEPSLVTSPTEAGEPSGGTSAMSTPPPEEETPTDGANDSPNDLIQAEINREAAEPIAAIAKVPKATNPARAAVIATVVITIILAGIAVFAYLSTQN